MKYITYCKPLIRWLAMSGALLVALLVIACADNQAQYSYVCTNGTPASGEASADGITRCVSCKSGFLLSRQACVSTSLATKLKASDAAGSDEFGVSVALASNYALIGAAQNDDSGSNSGSAYIFMRGSGSWSQTAKLTAGDGAAGDQFGISAALDGDYALIGANWDDDNGSNSGSSYIFRRSGTSWAQQAKLTASDGAAADIFGSAVALSGAYALIGARLDAIDSSRDVGSAYIFKRSGTSWAQEAKLQASDGLVRDELGVAVALDGDYALVGAHQDDIDGSTDVGSAYIFKRSGTSWAQEAKITASDGAANDRFGSSVALAGDYALVGASANSGRGAAYIFKRSGTSWTQQAKLTASDGAANDRFGSSVALAGDYALVGASANSGRGAAYIFKRSGTSWTQQAKLTASDGAANDSFGTSAAISSAYALIGADQDDDGGSDSGSVYILGF